jgi:hypothetical protein
MAAGAGQDGDARLTVGIELAKRRRQRSRRRPVDGVADFGAFDRHHPDFVAAIDAHAAHERELLSTRGFTARPAGSWRPE